MENREDKNNKVKLTIVFVNGSSFGKWCWHENFYSFFKKHKIQILTFDFIGHGIEYNKKVINRTSLRDYTKQLIDKLKNIDNEVIIVAHSVGCAIVLSELNKIFKYTKKLILLTPVGFNSMLIDYIKFIANYLRKGSIEKLYFNNRVSYDKYKVYSKKLNPVSTKLSLELLKGRGKNYTINGTDILIIASNNDLTIREASVLKLGKILGSKVIFFPDLCHAVMLDYNWEVVAYEILKFIT